MNALLPRIVKSPHIGKMHAPSFLADAKHLGFVLARYKFVAKMFIGMDRVLEVGCGDCTGSHVVRQVVGAYVGIDKEPLSDEAVQFDILAKPVLPRWNGIFALDVMEHIEETLEDHFLHNIAASLLPNGAVIIGMPSLESQPYASFQSERFHVNCKTEDGLRTVLKRHFHNVFMFGMNDETLHTGFGPLCHYRLAICTGAKLETDH